MSGGSARSLAWIGMAVLAGLLGAVGGVVVAALVLTIVDLFQSGHGMRQWSRQWVEFGALKFSWTDVLMCIALVLGGTAAAAGTWWLGKRWARR